MSIKKWLKKNTASLEGKRVVISGSTGGLGRELCFCLASLGAELVLLDRNSEKSLKLADELKEKHPSLRVSHLRADMSDFRSVKLAADSLSDIQL